MVICILANGYPNSYNPQIGCFEKDQASAFKDLGHEVILLYLNFKFSILKHKIEIKKNEENNVHIYGITGYGIYWLTLIALHIFYYKWNLKFRTKILEKLFLHILTLEQKPDIIYAHYLYNIAYGVNLRNKFNIPLVGIEHWSVINQPKLPKRIFDLGKMTYFKVDRLLAVSNSLSQSIKKHFGQNATVINNMVGKEFLVKQYGSLIKDEDSFNFLTIGSLLPIKGFDLLINAFHKTGLAKKKCRLIIIGGGTEQKNLQAQINKLSLHKSVTLVGRKNKQEIIYYMQNTHAFILSSHSETFSVVCIEAMAQGIPVIATACGGPEEFITKEVGILIKPSNIDELTDAMTDMYINYQSYDSKKIAKYCHDRFAPSVIAKQLIEIFNLTIERYGNE